MKKGILHLEPTYEELQEKVLLLEEAIRYQGRLTSLGELTRGIAHEINNPITGIINYAQILVDTCHQSGGDCELPARILKEGERVAGLVSKITRFVRQERVDDRPCHVASVLADILVLAGGQIKKDGIIVKTDIPENLPIVDAREKDIEQVMMDVFRDVRKGLNDCFPVPNKNKTLEVAARTSALGEKTKVVVTFRHPMADRSAIDAGLEAESDAFGGNITGNLSSFNEWMRTDNVEGEYRCVLIAIPAYFRE